MIDLGTPHMQPPGNEREPRLKFERHLKSRRGIAATVTGVLVVVIAAWAIGRRGEPANADETAREPSETERVDSVVTLDSAAQRFIGIKFMSAAATAGESLVANGTITYDANRASVVAPRAEGRILSVRGDLGQQVNAGNVLAVLESPDVGQAQGDLERARATLELARQNYERERRLFQETVSSRKDLLEAESAYRTAQADVNSAASRVRLFGAAGGAGGRYTLTAPIAGTIVERSGMPGQIAGPSTELFTIADMRQLWIAVDVYEGDASQIRPGEQAWVMPRGFPGERFSGKVSFAGAIVDTLSRTVKVRVAVPNQNLRLKPGMFAQVEFGIPTTVQGPIIVPESAVQDLNGTSIVFVPGAVAGQFFVRRVTVAERRPGGLIAIRSGLNLGEKVVAQGAFQLKSELLKATFGDDDK
jgi:cobalt-zinc-cadmium efflux system membrane fusion protein